MPSDPTQAFRSARDFLLTHRDDYAAAYAGFQWPKLDRFNWALDWFDQIAAGDRRNQTALWVAYEDGRQDKLTFAELSERSNRIANYFRGLGVKPWRPRAAHARQHSAAVGNHAGHDEAGRGDYSRNHAAHRQ